MPRSSPTTLDANGIVVDIGRALDVLKEVLKPLNYKNLDEMPEFKGVNTTTEFLTKYIFDRLAHHAREGDLGRDGRELTAIRITISESHVARASTRRRCGEARCVCGARRSCDADRRLCLRPPHDRGIARSSAGRSMSIGLGDGFPRPTPETKAAARDKLARRAEGLPHRCRRPGVWRPAGGRERVARHAIAARAGASSAGAGNRSCAAPTRRHCEISEYEALAAARGVVVTSPSTAQLLVDDYDVPPDLITVACPGTDRGEIAKGSSDGIVRLLAVGSVVPRKGYDVLIAALAPLADLPWRLTIAGDRTRDEAAALQLDAEIVEPQAWPDRSTCWARCRRSASRALYAGADLFVLPSRFEGYGMAFAEALAHGLPVVGTTAGAIPDTVPPDAGVLVEPNDVKALTRTLRMLIDESEGAAVARRRARARPARRCRPGMTQAKLLPARSRRWHELQRGLARIARALRPPRAQHGRDRCGGGGAFRRGRR